jgi:hypothetical protein
MVAIAFGDTLLTAGLLSPAPTTPPVAIAGAVGDTGATEVRLKVTGASPLILAATVKAPTDALKVTRILAVPSASVIAVGLESVAAVCGVKR